MKIYRVFWQMSVFYNSSKRHTSRGIILKVKWPPLGLLSCLARQNERTKWVKYFKQIPLHYYFNALHKGPQRRCFLQNGPWVELSRRSNRATPAGPWVRAAGRRWSSADAPASYRDEYAWTPTGSSSPSSWNNKTPSSSLTPEENKRITVREQHVYANIT